MIVQKAYKYRFFPTDSQKTQLARTFGCARFVWNQGLELRSKTYEETQQSLSYAQTTEALTRWKKEPEKVFRATEGRTPGKSTPTRYEQSLDARRRNLDL